MNFHGNLPAAIDFETTGLDPAEHEIIQVAVQPLTDDLFPHPIHPAFYETIRPVRPVTVEAMAVNGLDLDALTAAPEAAEVAMWLDEWFNQLGLPADRKLVPIAHNWAFENSFLNAWLGAPHKERLFHYHARDTAIVCGYLKDKEIAGLHENRVSLSLTKLCVYFGVANEKPHDALSDARACAELYRRLTLN